MTGLKLNTEIRALFLRFWTALCDWLLDCVRSAKHIADALGRGCDYP